MAESENIEQLIERTIKIYLESEGFADLDRGVKSVKREIDALRKSAKNAGNTITDLNKEMLDSVKKYISQQSKQSKEVTGLTKKYKMLGQAARGTNRYLGEMGIGLRKIAGFSSLGKMIGEAISFEKSLLKLSSSTNRLGIGITSLENKIISMSISTKLTRKETVELFSEFNKNYKFVSFREFESLLGRIQMMVGTNKEAIQGYMSSVSSLSQKYAGLAQQIALIGKGGTAEDEKFIASRLQMLYLTNQIGDSEYRNIIAVVRGNRQLSKYDRIRQQQAKDQVEAAAKFKLHMENVAISIGQTILPLLEKISDILDNLTNGGENWGKAMLSGIAILGTARLGVAALSMGGRALASGAIGAGGAAAAGGATGIGIAGAAGASMLPAAGVLGGVAVGGAVAYVGDRARGEYEDRSRKQSGWAAVGTETKGHAAGALSAGAGGALIGAAIGTFIPIPGLGTALGAAIGFATGSLIGLGRTIQADVEYNSDKARKARARTELVKRKAEAEINRGRKQETSDAMESGRMKGTLARTPGDMMSIYTSAATVRESFKIAEEKAYATLGGKEAFGAKIKTAGEGLQTARQGEGSIRADIKKVKDSEEGTKKERKERVKSLRAMLAVQKEEVAQREAAAEKLKEQENEILETLHSQNVELVKSEASFDAMKESIREMAEYAKELQGLKEAKFGLMGAEVERMGLTGNVDTGRLSDLREGTVATILKAVKAQESYLKGARMIQKIQGEEGKNAEKIRLADLVKRNIMTKEEASQYGDINSKLKDIVITDKEIIKAESIIIQKNKDLNRVVLETNKAFDARVKYAGLLASQAELQVQLADSYAISLGASAETRKRAFVAIGETINELEKKRQDIIKQQSEPQSEAIMLSLKTQRLTLENQITQEHIKQANLVKALRDGWIEAVGAMNTGAGTFTKIILDQNKGTAAALRLAGDAAVISSVSGSIRPGAGYRTSERFSPVGAGGISDITGATGKRDLAYRTTADEQLGLAVGGIQRMGRDRAIRDITARNRAAGSGNLTGVAFGGSRHYEGAIGEGMALQNNVGTVNVKVTLETDEQKIGEQIGRAVAPAVKRIVHETSAQIIDGISP